DLDHRQRGVEQAHVHELALAGAVAMPERGQRADRRVQRGVAIDHRRRGADRMALGLAGQGHEAAHRLAKRIERGTIAVRAALAAHHWRMPACLLAAGWLDLDDLGAEIRHEHAAARPGLEPRKLEHANAVETARSHLVSVATTFTA